EWVLAIGLRPATPPRITEDVDVGRPESQPEIAAVISLPLRLIVSGARLHADDVPLGVEQIPVPGRGHSDRLREDRRFTAARDSVQRLVPVGVGRYAQSWDGRRIVLHLRGFFRESHAPDQIA